MAVCGADNVWSCGMDGRVNHIRCGIEESVLTAIDYLSGMIY